jgi:hypothetical protein
MKQPAFQYHQVYILIDLAIIKHLCELNPTAEKAPTERLTFELGNVACQVGRLGGGTAIFLPKRILVSTAIPTYTHCFWSGF